MRPLVVLVAVAVLTVSACGSGGKSSSTTAAVAGAQENAVDGNTTTTTLVVTALLAGSEQNRVDLDPPGPSVGDRSEFSAPLVMGGNPAGELTAVLVTTRVGQGSGASAVKEERTGVMTFRFNDSDSISASGTSRISPNKKEPDVGDPQVRSVVGGTGAYADAEGSLSSVRNADGSYTYTFTLKRRP